MALPTAGTLAWVESGATTGSDWQLGTNRRVLVASDCQSIGQRPVPNFIAQFLGFLLYPIGMATLGWAVGWTVGLANTPLVASTLPLVFGLAAGGAGVYLSRANLAEPIDRGRFAVLGASMLLFAVSTVNGVLQGLADRAARDRAAAPAEAAEVAEAPAQAPAGEGHSAAPGRELVDFPLSEDPAEAIEALVLRRQLAAVGATVEEQRHVLMALALERLDGPDPASAAAEVRAELDVDLAIVRAGLTAAASSGPLGDSAAWRRAEEQLLAVDRSPLEAGALARERVALLTALDAELTADPADVGGALRGALNGLASRISLARADSARRNLVDPAAERGRVAREALGDLVRTLGRELPAGPSVTVVEPAPTTVNVQAAGSTPTAFGSGAVRDDS